MDNDVVRADLSDVILGIRPRIALIRLVTVNWFDAKLNSFSFGVRATLEGCPRPSFSSTVGAAPVSRPKLQYVQPYKHLPPKSVIRSAAFFRNSNAPLALMGMCSSLGREREVTPSIPFARKFLADQVGIELIGLQQGNFYDVET